jgi:indolepyruvate ferredoxin oxidoreductase beta subunit
MSKDFSLLLSGVGGQGLVLLSSLVGRGCLKESLRVITGEQHGLSQRSGTISIHLRIGPEVRSPLIPVGSGDVLLALEALEALRYIEYLKEGGIVVMNQRVTHPITETGDLVQNKGASYLTLDHVQSRIRQVTDRIFTVDARSLAQEAGSVLTENVVLLGALCVLEVFPVSMESMRRAMEEGVPARAREVNRKAFDLGAKAAYDRFCREMACKL